jgi:plastocyanin
MNFLSRIHARLVLLLWIAITVGAIPCVPAFADVTKAEATVVIDNFSFSPAQLSISAGSTVTWENHDDIPHTIVNDATPRDFKSPPVDSGEKFSQTFAKPGIYRYFCSLHPHMTGTITVQ